MLAFGACGLYYVGDMIKTLKLNFLKSHIQSQPDLPAPQIYFNK